MLSVPSLYTSCGDRAGLSANRNNGRKKRVGSDLLGGGGDARRGARSASAAPFPGICVAAER